MPAPTPTDEGYSTECRWDASNLSLISGHHYRVYFIVHDGDQNKTGGDCGQTNRYFIMPGIAPPTPTASPTTTALTTATATATSACTSTPTATASVHTDGYSYIHAGTNSDCDSRRLTGDQPQHKDTLSENGDGTTPAPLPCLRNGAPARGSSGGTRTNGNRGITRF